MISLFLFTFVLTSTNLFLFWNTDEEDDGYDEFDDDFDDDDYYAPPSRDGPVREGSVVLRSYWCELPEVVSSGLLQNLTPEEKKMQEVRNEMLLRRQKLH